MTNNCAIIYFIAYRTNRRLWDQKLKGLLWNASNAGRRVGGRWILSFVISQTFCSCLCLFLSHGEFTTESSKYLSGLVYGRPRPLWFFDGITYLRKCPAFFFSHQNVKPRRTRISKYPFLRSHFVFIREFRKSRYSQDFLSLSFSEAQKCPNLLRWKVFEQTP